MTGMEYIITFKNTNFAIKSEQYLLEAKLRVAVMPLPSQIKDGCGICLRISAEEIGLARQIIADKNIGAMVLYSRVTLNGKYIYSEIDAG